MKTLVMAEHGTECENNGEGGCYVRWATGGFCSGVRNAKWLNSLGEDDELYGKSTTRTNLDVRLNHLKGNYHIVALEPQLARLRAEERELALRLAGVRRELRMAGANR